MLAGNNKPSGVNLYFICLYLFNLLLYHPLFLFLLDLTVHKDQSFADLLQINSLMALAFFFFYQFELCTIHVFFCLLFVEMFRRFLLAAILVILLTCNHSKKIQLVFLKRQLTKDCFLLFLERIFSSIKNDFLLCCFCHIKKTTR